jgi:hypothetical protein
MVHSSLFAGPKDHCGGNASVLLAAAAAVGDAASACAACAAACAAVCAAAASAACGCDSRRPENASSSRAARTRTRSGSSTFSTEEVPRRRPRRTHTQPDTYPSSWSSIYEQRGGSGSNGKTTSTEARFSLSWERPKLVKQPTARARAPTPFGQWWSTNQAPACEHDRSVRQLQFANVLVIVVGEREVHQAVLQQRAHQRKHITSVVLATVTGGRTPTTRISDVGGDRRPTRRQPTRATVTATPSTDSAPR